MTALSVSLHLKPLSLLLLFRAEKGEVGAKWIYFWVILTVVGWGVHLDPSYTELFTFRC
jgi:hypothetical protein